MGNTKGSYVLLIRLESPRRIMVGKLGSIDFDEGYYAYVGSALNNLEKRIERHTGSRKKTHWHVDYLLEKADVAGVFMVESPLRVECKIADKLASVFDSIKGFGCSDCRCGSHLFCCKDKETLEKAVRDSLKN